MSAKPWCVSFVRRKLSNKIQEWALETKVDQVKGTLLEFPNACLGFQLTKAIQPEEEFTELFTKDIQSGAFLVLDYIPVIRYDNQYKGNSTFIYLVLVGESMFIIDENDLQDALENDTTNSSKENT